MKASCGRVLFLGAATWIVASWLVLSWPGAATGQDGDADPAVVGDTQETQPAPLPQRDAADLVAQLGAASFNERQQAERELLAMGLGAKAHLMEGLGSTDLHIRRACRRLLDDVLASDLRIRLDALLADPDGTAQHDLPCWERFRETVGSDPPARKLYLEMVKDEEGLLESFATGGEAAVSAFQLRVRQVRGQVYARTTAERRMPPVSTLAALTFVACDPVVRGTARSELSNVISLYQRREISEKLKKDESRDAVHRVLGQFILTASDTLLARQALQLAATLDIEEPGLRLALRLVKDKAQVQSLVGAIGVIGVLGGKEFRQALVPLLDDNRQCSVRTQNGKRISTEVREVAAAWLVHLTEQDLQAYGLGAAKNWFSQVAKNPAMCFSVSGIRFAEEDGGQKCVDKMKAWLADHPAPAIDLEPAPKADAPKPLAGQPEMARQGEDQERIEQDLQPTIVLADYTVARNLQAAREMVAEGDFVRVVTILGEILASDQESVYHPERNSVVFRSVRAEAASILNSLPRKGLSEYEWRFGPIADHALDKALQAGDLRAVADVQRRYLYTRAGSEAAYLLASVHRSRGRLWSAAAYLQRLKRVATLEDEQRALLSLELALCWLDLGRPDAVRRELQAWKEAWAERSIQLGGDEVTVFDDGDDPHEWLRLAVHAKPGASRASFVSLGDISGVGETPVGALWLDPKPLLDIAEEDLLEKLLAKISDEHRQQRRGAVSTLGSLVIGDVLVQRTPTELKAVDRITGQLRWRVPAENALTHVLRFTDVERQKRFADKIKASLERRLWQDAAWGALSSNGRLVFAVEDIGFDVGVDFQRTATRLDGTRQLDAAAYEHVNAVSAYDIRTGKLVWQIGEVFGESSRETRGGRFLGPPLPLGDRLYAVVNFPEDTRLMMLDASDGGVSRQWILHVRERATSNHLGGSTYNFQPPSPIHNALPVFADGVLVSSTLDGAFVAVDVIDGATLWVHEMRPEQTTEAAIKIQINGVRAVTEDDAVDRWSSTAATIMGDRVLLTRHGSDELTCVELRTGKINWTSPRWDGLFVGGRCEDTVVIVGRSGLRGVRLADGKPAWAKEVAPYPTGTVPVGRGYLSEGRYHVPLTSGEVATYEGATGRMAGRIRCPDSIQLGNLVPSSEMVVSASLIGTSRFPLLSEQRARLESVPAGTDDESLVHVRSRIALATGDTARAFDLLVRSRGASPNRESDELLLDAVLQGVALDPGRFIDRIDFVDDLMQSVSGRANDWLALAESLAENGRPSRALDIYDELARRDEALDDVQPVSASRVLRLDRRMAYGLGILRKNLGTADRDNVAARIQQRLTEASSLEQLSRYGDQPETSVHCLRLADQLVSERKWIQADLLLRRAWDRGTSVQRDEATGQLGSLLAAANRPLEAAFWRAAFGRTAEDTPATEADAGAEYRSPWGDDPIQVGKESVSNRPSTDPLRIGRQMPVLLDTADGPRAITSAATYESRSRKLTSLDRWGRKRFEMVLPEVKATSGISINVNSSVIHGVSVGNLLIVHRGDTVVAIDCLADPPKQLWSEQTGSPTASSSAHALIVNAIRNRLGGGRANQLGSLPRRLAASSDYVCFQRGRELIAIDPLTAELLWSRDDLPSGCDLIGDGEHILATPSVEGPTSVLRSADGKLIDRRTTIPRTERLAVFGGQVLRFEDEAKPPRCGLFDVRREEYVWQREIPPDAKLAMIGNSGLGIVDATGVVTVLGTADGAENLCGKIDLPEDCSDVAFVPFDDVIVCAANVPPDDKLGQVINTHYHSGRPVHGKLFGLDAASGALLWSNDIADQQLRLIQPPGVPVLTACNRYQKRVKVKANSYRHESPQLLLELIDIRNGRVLHKDSRKNASWANYEFSTDLEERKVLLEVFDQKIDLKFVAKAD